jgi:hypothetical protein
MPPQQPGPDEPLTLGDRLVSALAGGLCGFATMLLVWFVVTYWWGEMGRDAPLRFYWTFVAGGVAAVLGVLTGQEPLMDGFGKAWAAIGLVLVGRPGR